MKKRSDFASGWFHGSPDCHVHGFKNRNFLLPASGPRGRRIGLAHVAAKAYQASGRKGITSMFERQYFKRGQDDLRRIQIGPSTSSTPNSGRALWQQSPGSRPTDRTTPANPQAASPSVFITTRNP